MEWKEPTIIINSVHLTSAQAMTLRVALETFAADLRANGLGDDDVGRALCHEYQERISAIREFIMLPRYRR